MDFSTDPRPAPADCMTMAEVRVGVDALDRLLVAVLAERQRYMDAAARIKPDRAAVRDETRIEDGVRSPAWAWASWATVANPAFATLGNIIPAAVTLHYQGTNGQMMLTWTTGTLQSAPAITGPYTDIPEATSPYIVVPTSEQQYFRIKPQP